MTIVEVKFYAAELRALLACASTDDARINLCAVHFSTDLSRVFATDGHRLLLRHATDVDPRTPCDTFSIERAPLESALALAEAADRHDSTCSECDAPTAVGCEEWAQRIVLAVEDGKPRLTVSQHVIHVGNLRNNAPPVWAVLPAEGEVGKGRGRMIQGRYLGDLEKLSEAVEARCGRNTGAWCIAFAGEAVLPDGKPNGRDFGPLVATCEAPTGHEYSWTYVVMPLRPTEPGQIAWHERVNGAVPNTTSELESEAAK